MSKWTEITIDVPVDREHPLLDEIATAAFNAADKYGLDAHVGGTTRDESDNEGAGL